MKIALFSLSYLNGKDALMTCRLQRTLRWVRYYTAIKKEIGFDDIVLVDNASEPWRLDAVRDVAPVHFIEFGQHLSRGYGYDYPYCWRALWEMKKMTNKYDKFICIDTDTFVLNKKLSDYIRELNSGWVTFFSPKYKFPTAELHILCKDSFEVLNKFCPGDDFMIHNGKRMETVIPFTEINRDFRGDRYGEDRIPQNSSMDFYSQCPGDIDVNYQNR